MHNIIYIYIYIKNLNTIDSSICWCSLYYFNKLYVKIEWDVKWVVK